MTTTNAQPLIKCPACHGVGIDVQASKRRYIDYDCAHCQGTGIKPTRAEVQARG